MSWLQPHQGQTVERLAGELRTLERHWERLDFPIHSALRPGIDPAAVDELAETHGVTVPIELTVLWSWHDGSEDTNHRGNAIGPGMWEFLPAEKCFELMVTMRKTNVHLGLTQSEDSDVALEEPYWRRSWIPLMLANDRVLFADSAREDRWGTAPLRWINREWEGCHVDAAGSLAQTVNLWNWVLGQDLYLPLRQMDGTVLWDMPTTLPGFVRDTGLA